MEDFKPIVWGNFYNPESAKIIKNRILVNKLAEESTEFQKRILEKCKEDKIFWINNFVWSADPRNLDIDKPVLTPFKCFPKQEEYIKWRMECRKEKKRGFLNKSRDSGASWLNVADQTHSFLFEKGFKGGFASRRESYVDSLGDLNSLFEKIRFILRYLPVWMKPVGDEIIDNYMRIINLKMESSITGEAGINIGRGGRLTIQDIDEAAFIEQADSVARALSQTVNTVIWTSTPNGKSNYFAKSYLEGKNKTFFIHWTHDPRKDEEWYKTTCESLDELTIAREIDGSFEESAENTLFKYKKLTPCINAINARFPAPLITMGLDVSTSGKNKSIYTIMIAGCIVVKQDEIKTDDPNELAAKAHHIAIQNNVDILVVDVIGVGEGTVSTLASIYGRQYKVIPYRGNDKVTNRYWETFNAKSKQLFRNIRAEVYFLLREKVEKTYLHQKGIRQADTLEMISFNMDGTNTLFSQLEQVEAIKDPSGIWKIMSKEEMREKGIQSPDYSDSLCMALAGTIMGRGYKIL